MATSGDPWADNSDPMTGQAENWNNLEHLFRVAGPDRVSTSIKLMNSSSKEWGRTVIIARSDDFADALASGPLADVLDAPVLLSAPGSRIDARVLAAIDAGGFARVELIGGTGVFTEGARTQLEGLGYNVVRDRGVDRYETAVGIAKRTLQIGLDDPAVTKRNVNVYLATGVDFPDALAAGAAAADNDGVVLLTKDKVMEDFTYNFLTRQADTIHAKINGIEIHTVGGQAETAAKARIEDIADTNTGADRYATAAMLFGKYKNGINKVAIVSGEGFADGVVAGAWVANHDGALLLTKNAMLPAPTKAILATPTWADGDTDIVVVGGTGSVSPAVSAEIAELMTW
ncbi:MAG: cell wall-binding repeat-containing protein [Nostocoides sp.]